jgi:hypothetical protein
LPCCALALLGCERLLDAPEYRVEGTTPEVVDASPLVRRFAGTRPTQACVSCLELGACGESFATCEASESCSELAECMLDEASPSSDAWCVTRLEPSEADRASARSLFECFRTCVRGVECEGGDDFACVDDYTWPASAPNPTIKFTQTLSYIYEAPVADATVTFCPPGGDCERPLTLSGEPLIATTDETGTYSVEVPIVTATSTSDGGFQGFRLVEGEAFDLHRLETNVRRMVDHAESTKLLPREASDLLIERISEDSLADSLILMQVFDCKGIGAGDMFLEFPETPEGVAYYKDGASPVAWRSDGTLASQEGAVGVGGLSAGRFHRVIARTRDGRAVADTDIWVPEGQIFLYGLYPKAKVQ